jgi:hypothetical protein
MSRDAGASAGQPWKLGSRLPLATPLATNATSLNAGFSWAWLAHIITTGGNIFVLVPVQVLCRDYLAICDPFACSQDAAKTSCGRWRSCQLRLIGQSQNPDWADRNSGPYLSVGIGWSAFIDWPHASRGPAPALLCSPLLPPPLDNGYGWNPAWRAFLPSTTLLARRVPDGPKDAQLAELDRAYSLPQSWDRNAVAMHNPIGRRPVTGSAQRLSLPGPRLHNHACSLSAPPQLLGQQFSPLR